MIGAFQAGVLGQSRGVRKTILYSASFTNNGASNVPIASYTPEIGNICLPLHSYNSGSSVVALAPSSVVVPQDYMTYASTTRGPIIDIGVSGCELEFTILGVGSGQHVVVTTNGTDPALGLSWTGMHQIRINSTSIEILLTSTVTDTSAITITDGDVICIVDDGTTGVGCIKVFVNNNLVLSSSSTPTRKGTFVGLSLRQLGSAIDDLVITEY